MSVTAEPLRLSGDLQRTAKSRNAAWRWPRPSTASRRCVRLPSPRAGDQLEVSRYKITGRPVPVVTKGVSPLRTAFTRGYRHRGLDTNDRRGGGKFERILDVIIEHAAIETRLRRLARRSADEAARERARADHGAGLREQVAYVRQVLDERAARTCSRP